MVALLVATSGAMAVARGHAKTVAGQVILCTGQGVLQVAVDAQGQPVGAIHICPECALGLFDHCASAQEVIAPVIFGTADPVTSPPVPVAWNTTQTLPPARGPPVAI